MSVDFFREFVLFKYIKEESDIDRRRGVVVYACVCEREKRQREPETRRHERECARENFQTDSAQVLTQKRKRTRKK